ncbi:MAG: transporter [Candidatus Dadabacteria bacterium]|nr:MAG: transporter [Candidatus Dadabacteria bacterium]
MVPSEVIAAPRTLFDASGMRDFVARSPVLVAARDRAAWVELFCPDATVEDPVGTRPANGRDEIGRFWDTFIASTDIVFDVHADLVGGPFVFRDVTINTTLDGSVKIAVPAHLVYELSDTDETCIRSLGAYWPLRRMIPQVLGTGLRGSAVMLRLTMRMLSNGGAGPLAGYTRGLTRGVFDGGRAAVERLLRDPEAELDRCERVRLAWDDATADPAGIVAQRLRGATIETVLPSGWFVTFRYRRDDGQQGAGRIAFAGSLRRPREVLLYV